MEKNFTNDADMIRIVEMIEEGLNYALDAFITKYLDSSERDKVIPKIKKAQVEKNRDRTHGDFSSNFAMQNAKVLGMKPADLADRIIDNVLISEEIISYEVALPGYINIRLKNHYFSKVLENIVKNQKEEGNSYRIKIAEGGKKQKLRDKKILLEFVSANPTGPLHVGHGRGAAYGASLANLLRYVGNKVDCEYYVNNAGRQMDILTLSVYWRYAEIMGDSWELPKGIYQGSYVKDIAQNLKDIVGGGLYYPLKTFIPVLKEFSEEEIAEGKRDLWIDEAIFSLKEALGVSDYRRVFLAGLNAELSDIENDLKEFGVKFEKWFPEDSLFEDGKIDACLDKLEKSGYLYEENNAIWFKSKEFGDDKDRVVKRENGLSTYFASDIAYHADKFARNYDLMIDIWGADHHGYIARVKAALEALGLEEQKLQIALVQFAVLYQDGKKVQMSTRSGEFITLRKLREMVGSDAARFFYVMKKPDKHMDFDLDLATSNSKDNPYYYVQYAHARTCRVFEKAQEAGFNFSLEMALENRELLNLKEEVEIISLLNEFELMLFNAADNLAPQNLIEYLKDLASAWHKYYEAQRILVDDEKTRNARLLLTKAVQIMLREILLIVGVSAKEKM